MGRRLRSGAALLLVVLAGLAVVLTLLVGAGQAGTALLGALGWLVALAARVPAVASAGRLRDLDRGRALLAFASAVTDEVVRLLLVLVGVTGFAPALWAGLGRAVAELVFVTATGLSQSTVALGRARPSCWAQRAGSWPPTPCTSCSGAPRPRRSTSARHCSWWRGRGGSRRPSRPTRRST
ncbi:hypothetical protein ABTZ99_07040 [Actinosynnema sp. NPDC002837]